MIDGKIVAIMFERPIALGAYAPDGTDYYTPARYQAVRAAREDGGVRFSFDGVDAFVPMHDIAAIVFRHERGAAL